MRFVGDVDAREQPDLDVGEVGVRQQVVEFGAVAAVSVPATADLDGEGTGERREVRLDAAAHARLRVGLRRIARREVLTRERGLPEGGQRVAPAVPEIQFHAPGVHVGEALLVVAPDLARKVRHEVVIHDAEVGPVRPRRGPRRFVGEQAPLAAVEAPDFEGLGAAVGRKVQGDDVAVDGGGIWVRPPRGAQAGFPARFARGGRAQEERAACLAVVLLEGGRRAVVQPPRDGARLEHRAAADPRREAYLRLSVLVVTHEGVLAVRPVLPTEPGQIGAQARFGGAGPPAVARVEQFSRQFRARGHLSAQEPLVRNARR